MSADRFKEFYKLVVRYLKGDVTSVEKEALDNYYNVFDDEIEITSRMTPKQLKEIELRIRKNINKNRGLPYHKAYPFYRNYKFYPIAATILIAISIVLIIKFPSKQKHLQVAKIHIPIKIKDINHFVTLTDGSHILVRRGSKLTISNNFGKNSREVTLTGEAYFDIKHDNYHPFLIHTGKFTTTVLGTAFTIKAYPKQNYITVTVNRGRVKVERDNNLLAILNKNEQITALATPGGAVEKLREINTDHYLQWASSDMIFDYKPLGELVPLLEERYGVKIRINSPNISKCKITGEFNGTETLNQILETLSQAINTTYVIKNKEVVIDGPGC